MLSLVGSTIMLGPGPTIGSGHWTPGIAPVRARSLARVPGFTMPDLSLRLITMMQITKKTAADTARAIGIMTIGSMISQISQARI